VADEAHQRLIGRCSWVAAWVGLWSGKCTCCPEFATAEGVEDLALPATAAGAVPAGSVAPVRLG
jgi:hypothetical protein